MKIFLAATSTKEFMKEKLFHSKYILESFYSFKEWQLPLVKQCEMFLLDSGAFTFMNNFKGTVNWDDYVEKYADFINKNDIRYFFELDIDALVGLKEVERLRTKLERLTKKRCIPVWHKSRGIDYYRRMCKEYDYIAIGGIVIKEITPQEYKYFTPLLRIAKQSNCKVHGLGFTSTSQLHKYPFYSVDSTNWQSGGRFGQLHLFNGKKIISKSFKGKRAKDYKKIDTFNFDQWIKFQNYANTHL